jgi:hypothetical protein
MVLFTVLLIGAAIRVLQSAVSGSDLR